ncbi:MULTISPECIES: NmrA family NAD(P)-binding protein [unclassified Rhizobium]|uniref:NmrA family NAD(P)-binding protein n=1 Tax=unclassified Rhizobium TaxID=2613769 RepID=UPI000CDF51D2|nr:MULTISPECIES: NmrA family NAD(P)-binding protein [Rhizobium]AVA22708.1 NmrA-like family protein [Rhizobium sp. NXC24]UWU20085.1 NmrA family NAD(P)-binding protein [Rhizobium tropici]
MFAITAVTGKVGGTTARALISAGHRVRAVLRDRAKGAEWEKLGAEVAVATFDDADALARAFDGTEGVFVMASPNFAPDPGFPSARRDAAAQAAAIQRAQPGKVVMLSSIGGQRTSGLGLITQVHMLEEALAPLTMPVATLRPTWFMENSLWDIAPARATGEMPSYLAPLDKPYPMIATADIGAIAARTMAENWTDRRVIEIEGPKRYSQIEIATLIGQAIGRPVVAKPVPRAEWEERFRAQGAAWPEPRIEMIENFNSGWIDFEPAGVNEHVVAPRPFETVLAELAKIA